MKPLWQELAAGPKGQVPETVYVIVEVPKGSNTKYEMDEETGAFFLNRDLFTSMVFPADYGCIPHTIAEDGDPLDALVLVSNPHIPGIVIESRPIAVIRMEDEKGRDDKLICVPVEKIDPEFKKYGDVQDIPPHLLTEIKHFFQRYKELEPGKWTNVERVDGADVAKSIILEAMESYRETAK